MLESEAYSRLVLVIGPTVCTELAVSSLAVAETIAGTHCAYEGMTRLSWPG